MAEVVGKPSVTTARREWRIGGGNVVSLLVVGVIVLAGLWLAWKLAQLVVRVIVIGGVAAVLYFVILPRIGAWF